jgi:hypothetical protein
MPGRRANLSVMTRSDAIALISAKLETLDGERLQAIVNAVAEMDEQALTPSRKLTSRELELIEQSKDDFRAGRTYSLSEARAASDVFIASLRQKYPSAP